MESVSVGLNSGGLKTAEVAKLLATFEQIVADTRQHPFDTSDSILLTGFHDTWL